MFDVTPETIQIIIPPKIIYGLVDNTTMELRYVGKTTRSLAARWKGHLELRKTNAHLNNWLSKADISMIVLERDPEDLNEAEIRWIREMREQGARLLNIAPGGTGGYLGPCSLETRAKMSVSKKGHPYWGRKPGWRHTEEAKRKISTAHTGMSTPYMGHPYWGQKPGWKHTAEARAKMVAARRKERPSDD